MALHIILSLTECLKKYHTLNVVLSHIKDPMIRWLHMCHVHVGVTQMSTKYNRRNLKSQCPDKVTIFYRYFVIIPDFSKSVFNVIRHICLLWNFKIYNLLISWQPLRTMVGRHSTDVHCVFLVFKLKWNIFSLSLRI